MIQHDLTWSDMIQQPNNSEAGGQDNCCHQHHNPFTLILYHKWRLSKTIPSKTVWIMGFPCHPHIMLYTCLSPYNFVSTAVGWFRAAIPRVQLSSAAWASEMQGLPSCAPAIMYRVGATWSFKSDSTQLGMENALDLFHESSIYYLWLSWERSGSTILLTSFVGSEAMQFWRAHFFWS